MRLLISGGGTGGHIYPALALIEEVKKKQPDSQILYVGTTKGLESRIVPNAGIDFKTIEIQGFKRSLSLQNFKTVYLFLKSVRDAKQIIREFKPDVVVGTGGYVCGSVVYAAAKLGVATFIHEQNSVAGVTNKFLSRYVDKIGICFDDVSTAFPKQKVVFTGNPRAQQVVGIKSSQRLKDYGLQVGKKTVLIFGGSRGAKKINETAIQTAPLFDDKDYQVLFVTGQVHYQQIKEKFANIQLPDNFVMVPYIDDMPELLPDIDVIVGRAGATSLAEITALGIPSVLIPSPYVTHDHQTSNALSLVNKKAALMIKEDQLTTQSLFEALDDLLSDEQKRQEMAQNAKKAGVADASDRVIDVLENIMHK